MHLRNIQPHRGDVACDQSLSPAHTGSPGVHPRNHDNFPHLCRAATHTLLLRIAVCVSLVHRSCGRSSRQKVLEATCRWQRISAAYQQKRLGYRTPLDFR